MTASPHTAPTPPPTGTPPWSRTKVVLLTAALVGANLVAFLVVAYVRLSGLVYDDGPHKDAALEYAFVATEILVLQVAANGIGLLLARRSRTLGLGLLTASASLVVLWAALAALFFILTF